MSALPSGSAPPEAGVGPALRAWLVGQFGRPRGAVGALAGWIMERRASNVARNQWTVELMALEAHHHVLEIGFGPGLALGRIADRLDGGVAVGLDHSRTMVAMAARRNRAAIRAGKVRLCCGSVEDPGFPQDRSLEGPFDRILAVNVVPFWRDRRAVLRRLADRLAPGGAVLLTVQKRFGDTSREAALALGSEIAADMAAAGLGATRIETLETVDPVAVCVIGAAAGEGGSAA